MTDLASHPNPGDLGGKVYFVDPRYTREPRDGEPGCGRCTVVHERCPKHTEDPEGSGRYRACGKYPRRGAKVCDSHGGKAPQVLRKARERVALADAAVELTRLGYSVETDPAVGMLEEFHRACADVEVYRRQVMLLEAGRVEDPNPEVDDSDLGGLRPRLLGGSLAINAGNERERNKAFPHIWVVMYHEAQDRKVRYGKLCIEAGVEIRYLEMLERVTTEAADEYRVMLDRLLAELLALAVGLAPERRQALEAAWTEQVPRIVGVTARAIDEEGTT